MFRQLTPVVRALLYANVIIFLLMYPMGEQLIIDFALWPWHGNVLYGAPPFEPWQVISYAFLHEGFWHLFGNMFALYMFGPDCEALLGSRRFTTYYFVCVIGAAVSQLLVTHYVYPGPYPTLGASGGIFGVLLLYGLAFPHRRLLLLFPPIPMPAWLFVTLYGLLELGLGVSGTAPSVAHFAHLGGMAAGYLLIVFWRARSRSHSQYLD
jgi:membrane associated rhomboid family serine protease